jgi:hypothetical protein
MLDIQKLISESPGHHNHHLGVIYIGAWYSHNSLILEKKEGPEEWLDRIATLPIDTVKGVSYSTKYKG